MSVRRLRRQKECENMSVGVHLCNSISIFGIQYAMNAGLLTNVLLEGVVLNQDQVGGQHHELAGRVWICGGS